MRITLAISLLMLYASLCAAQISAVTSTGEEVILLSDGTWKYVKAPGNRNTEVAVNPTLYVQNKDATFQVKSTIVNAGVYLNSRKWSFKKGEADAAAEYTFELKKKDAYAMLIAERIEMPLESLKNVAFDNAKTAAPDVQIVREEYRTVNGRKILCMQMEGTVSGIKFTYFGYYFSGPQGILQLLTYTSQNLFEQYRADLEELLNGLVVAEM